MDKDSKRHEMSEKIRLIMHEGVDGKKVKKNQAVAIALSMLKNHKS